MQRLHTIDYAIIIFYLISVTVIGLILTRRASKNLDHYFLGNRSLPWWVLGIAGMSNWFDLTGTMLVTSFLYMLGPRGLYVEFRSAAVLGLAFMLAYLGKWHRRSGCMTGIEWLTFRYGDTISVQYLRLTSAILCLITTIFWMAYIVRGTTLFMGIMFPYPPVTMTVLIVILTAVYTMCAGFYGVVVTDVIQGVIIILACVVIALMAWHLVPNASSLAEVARSVTGNTEWTGSLPSFKTTMPKGYEMYQCLFMVAFFYLLRNIIAGLGCGAESRYFGARNDRECGLQSLLQGVTIMFRWPLMAGLAVMGIYMVHNFFPDHAVVTHVASLIHTQFPAVAPSGWHELTSSIAVNPTNYPSALTDGIKGLLGIGWQTKLPLVGYNGSVNPEQVLPMVLMNSVPMGLAGFIIVAMLAAMKGCLAGGVNGTAAFFVKDIYQLKIRPKAGNRELVASAWLSTLAVMCAGLWLGCGEKSINDLWGWFIMGLGAGGLAPAMLRLYWWRCNCWGMIWGMILGTVGALLQRYFFHSMSEPMQFMIMTALSFVGTIGGSLLTKPTPMEVLRPFYRITRPFGFWAPLKKEMTKEENNVNAAEHYNDILTVPFAMLWQVTIFLMPMQLIVKSYGAFWKTMPLFLIGLAGMYWFWWRNLPPADAGPIADVEQASKSEQTVKEYSKTGV